MCEAASKRIRIMVEACDDDPGLGRHALRPAPPKRRWPWKWPLRGDRSPIPVARTQGRTSLAIAGGLGGDHRRIVVHDDAWIGALGVSMAVRVPAID